MELINRFKYGLLIAINLEVLQLIIVERMKSILKQEEKKEISSYFKQNLEAMLEMFKKEAKNGDRKWVDDDWILLTSYSLAHISLTICKSLSLYKSPRTECPLQAVLEDPHVQFLLGWLQKTGTHRDHNFKDRKNSFFRLLLKHLKSKVKENEHSEQLKDIQSSLNHNTISNKQVSSIHQIWKHQINGYFESGQLLRDIVHKSKSKASRYFYILHLPEIKAYLDEHRLNDFPFYEKLDLRSSLKRIILKIHGEPLKEELYNQTEEEELYKQLYKEEQTYKQNEEKTYKQKEGINHKEDKKPQTQGSYMQEDVFAVLSLGAQLDPGQPITISGTDNYLFC